MLKFWSWLRGLFGRRVVIELLPPPPAIASLPRTERVPAPQRTWLVILNPVSGEPRVLETVFATDAVIALRMARTSQAAREKAEPTDDKTQDIG